MSCRVCLLIYISSLWLKQFPICLPEDNDFRGPASKSDCKMGNKKQHCKEAEIVAGSGLRKLSVPHLVNYYMLMIKLLIQIDHSDWKRVYLQELQLSIVWSTGIGMCLTK